MIRQYLSMLSSAMIVFAFLGAGMIYAAESRGIFHEKFDPSPDLIGAIAVEILDSSEDECWSNMREIVLFAESSLRESGYRLTYQNRHYFFSVALNAKRSIHGACFGNISVTVFKFVQLRGKSGQFEFGQHVFGRLEKIHWTPENFNSAAMEVVKLVLDEM